MMKAIKYNLSHLTDFSGRDARQTFWYFVLFIVVVQFLVGLVATIPSMVGMLGSAFDAASTGADEAEIQAALAGEMGGMVSQQIWIGAIASLISCGLFVAAFVRRLHDAGFTGWIAVIPAAFTIYSVSQTIGMIDEAIALAEATMADPDSASALEGQRALSWAGMLGYIGYIVVIGFGVLKSQDGPNKYGNAPVKF